MYTLSTILVCFQTVAVSYFTTQRLHHINETAALLSPNVTLVGQNGLELSPINLNLESLEQDVRNLNRKVSGQGNTRCVCSILICAIYQKC